MTNPQAIRPQLEQVFKPRSVAVVGVSSRMDNPGSLALRSIIDMGFEGDLYPVNPKYEETLGLKCYPTVHDTPSPPDLVILSTPPDTVPALVSDCVEAGANACVINSAGFSETGRPEGKALEAQVLDAIDGSRLRLIGPNCMGIYSSPGKLALFGGQRSDDGSVSFISQSGSICSILYLLGAERGIRFAKMVSSGNELDLNCSDYLDYFADDQDTSVIAAYLEQVREPRRFLDTARRLRGVKPLIICRAGLTEGGKRAAASHTGALAGSEEIWQAVSRQVGIIEALDMADVVDTLSLFHHLEGKSAGRRVCVVSPPGGIAVSSADAVERSGLLLPTLGERTRENLVEVLPSAGTSINNPVDMGFGAVIPGNMEEVIRVVAEDDAVDTIIVVGGAPAYREGDFGLMKMHASEIKAAAASTDKPVVGIGMPSGFAFPYISELGWEGIPCFITPTAACKTLARFLDFHGL